MFLSRGKSKNQQGLAKIAFFGTDEFAAQTLETLINASVHELHRAPPIRGAESSRLRFKIALVVTQPDRPTGRKQEMEPPPVKIVAEKYGIEVLQPETLKNISTTVGDADLRPLPMADINIVYRYGLIIPKNILDIPTHGTINIHPSLLPKYRGASPIQTAIMNGDAETGITIMQMDEAMDHGSILAQEIFPIELNDTYETLSRKMTPRVNELLLQIIPKFISGEIKPKPQDDAQVTFTKILSRDDGKIDWAKSAQEIYNQYRGLTPWPGVWTMWEGKRLKLLTITPSPVRGGTVGGVSVENEKIYISCGADAIEVLELQLEGKKPMEAKIFIQGYQRIHGLKLI